MIIFHIVALSSLLASAGDSAPNDATQERSSKQDDVIFGQEDLYQESEHSNESPDININNDAAMGVQGSEGSCPCFRWRVRIELLSGEVVWKNLLISSDAFFEFLQTQDARRDTATANYFRLGAFEVLSRGARIGVGFKGVMVGKDIDQNYSQIVKTGFYFLANLLRTEAVRLDLRTGYDLQSLSVNTAPLVRRDLLSEAVSFKWQTGRLKGRFQGTVFADKDGLGYSATTSAQVKAIKLGGLSFGMGLEATYSYDPFRLDFGLTPNIGIAGIYLDVGYDVISPKKAHR